jgi:hypothetical protein
LIKGGLIALRFGPADAQIPFFISRSSLYKNDKYSSYLFLTRWAFLATFTDLATPNSDNLSFHQIDAV